MPFRLNSVLLPLLGSLCSFFLRHILDADDPSAGRVRLTPVILAVAAAAAAAAAAIADELPPLRIVQPRVRDGRLAEFLLCGPDAGSLRSRVRLPLVSLTAGPSVDGAGRDKGGGAGEGEVERHPDFSLATVCGTDLEANLQTVSLVSM